MFNFPIKLNPCVQNENKLFSKNVNPRQPMPSLEKVVSYSVATNHKFMFMNLVFPPGQTQLILFIVCLSQTKDEIGNSGITVFAAFKSSCPMNDV